MKSSPVQGGFRPQFEGVEVIGIESGGKYPADLLKVVRDLEFFGCSTDGKIVDENVPLLDGSLRNPADFTKFQVSKMLNANVCDECARGPQ